MKFLLLSIVAVLLVQNCFCEEDITLPSKCEDVLRVDQCTSLRRTAQVLGAKVEHVLEAVQEAVKKGYKESWQVIQEVRNKIFENSKNFKCENVLSSEKCSKIVEIGKKLNLKAEEILEAVKSGVLFVRGKVDEKLEIYERAISKLFLKVKNLKCTDLTTADNCKKISDFATKVKLSSEEALQAVKEAFLRGATKAQDIYAKAKDYLKAKISCNDNLGKDTCDRIRRIADRFFVSMTKVDEIIRETLAKGVSKISDIFEAAKNYIIKIWQEKFGRDKRDLTNVKNVVKEKITKILNSLLEKMKIVDKTVRAAIMKAVEKAKEKGKIPLSKVKSKLKEIIEKVQGKLTSDDDDENNDSGKSLRQRLLDLLQKVHGKAKEVIQKILSLSKKEFEKVKELMKKYLSKSESDEMENDFEMLQAAVEDSATEVYSNLVEDILDQAEY